MKHAYVSLVLVTPSVPNSILIKHIDDVLSKTTRAHEIVFVIPYEQFSHPSDIFGMQGPVSIVTTQIRSTRDGAIIAGLGRSVGDFVLEWRGPLAEINEEMVKELLEQSNAGIELVEIIGIENSTLSRIFLRLVNIFRSKEVPIRKTVGRLLSRRAIQKILGGSNFEPQLDVLIAELPIHRSNIVVPFANFHHDSFFQRISEGSSLLSKGTRFGTAVPLILAGGSALFAGVAALYSVGIFLFRGQAPQGWTTLMIVIGLGQAAILTLLGLTWTRIDSLTKGLSQPADITADVTVIAPNGKENY
jgi:hypothetical protein